MTLLALRGEGPKFPTRVSRCPSWSATATSRPDSPPWRSLAFMRDIGAVLTPGSRADPDRMREIYARHASRLLP